MKYILMMSGTKANFDWYTTWSKADLQANTAHMRAFSEFTKGSQDSNPRSIATTVAKSGS